MHGKVCEERKRVVRLHMWRIPSRATASVLSADGSFSSLSLSSSSSSSSAFHKDGRKISVGDCALFKPPQDSPPFIGIIRVVTKDKEKKLKLGVNWLYRPAEVKLGKGILLEAAPNEVFYSFHQDVISAASLLHPCKVAFLPKGVKLPSEICSFVCRRVYDISNKCLWWLTDQDYIDERQEEVNQLLYKTRLEMHATIQQGGHSPKPMNSPTSTSQLKSGTDNTQNNISVSSQVGKGRKRERLDQGSEPVKRERTFRMDDSGSGPPRTESSLKSEIASIAEKGGLVGYEGVEKLVQLMVPERNEKKIDLVSRSMLASVVAATDKSDCLSGFVQLRGLPVFDEWLQEVHKGKIGDNISPKDSDKSIEEFLLILLRALDKLPVNLNALQTCNIGKSVNHLRSHKNLEIQKKARSLVDTWKKRVEAEMDAKSGSNQGGAAWPSRARQHEASHLVKTSVTQGSASKTSPVKSATTSPTSFRSALSPASDSASLKDGQLKSNTAAGGVSVSDVPVMASKDEKSSGSSQSHNNSQSCSSDQAKTAGSMTVNKSSGGSSRHRKSMKGFQGSSPSASQRETGSNRSYLSQRKAASEKLSHSSLTFEKTLDVPATEGSSNKVIVKISNRGRSPAQSASGGSFEDPAVMSSRASSPAVLEKHDQLDRNSKEKIDTYRANFSSDVIAEFWQSNEFRDGLKRSDEGGASPPTLPGEERCKILDDTRKTTEVLKASYQLTGNEPKSGKPHGGSLSSMNALVESCVRYSEMNASMAVVDDGGMNLLASVAADEMSKSDISSSCVSPLPNAPVVEQSSGFDVKPNLFAVDDFPREQNQSIVGANNTNGAHDNQHDSGDRRSTEPENTTDSQPVGDDDESLDSETKDLQQLVDQCLESNENSKDVRLDDDINSKVNNTKAGDILNGGQVLDTNQKLDSSLLTEGKTTESSVKEEALVIEGQLHSCSEQDADDKKEQKQQILSMSSELVRGPGEDDESKTHKADEMIVSHLILTEPKTEGECSAPMKQLDVGFDTSVTNHKVENAESKEGDGHERLKGSRLSSVEGDEAEECTSVARDVSSVSASGGSNMDAKVEFDLNEGFNGEDGRNDESNNFMEAGSSIPVQSVGPLSSPVASVSSGLPPSITVAAAAKGPFVPPDDLLRNRGSIGWKGSAATSAFRPAEPRKVLEASLGMNNASSSDASTSTGKQTRLPLDIDLNIPDERVLEDLGSQRSAQVASSTSGALNNFESLHIGILGPAAVHSSGGFDLDLNRADEPTDLCNHTVNNSHRLDTSFQPVKSSSGGLRDFDLNDGPIVDDVNADSSMIFSQQPRSSLHSQPTPGIRVNGADMGNFSSWFSSGGTYSAVSIPSVLPDRGDQPPFPVIASGGPQRMLGPAAGPSPLNPDVYRGPVLSSSPAVPFQSTPFQYPVFPFGSSFAVPSTAFSGGSTAYVDSSSGGRLCFPAVNSQLLGPAVAIPANYPRPYVVSLPNGNGGGGSDSSGKWFRPGLDLNSGPGGPETELRDETSSLASRSVSASSDQGRLFQMSGVLKRKDLEGGWDGYKQSSWQ